MTCLSPLYLPRHAATAEPSSGFDWNVWVLPAARLVGGLLLDVAIVVVAIAVVLLVGSPAVDLYLSWRR